MTPDENPRASCPYSQCWPHPRLPPRPQATASLPLCSPPSSLSLASCWTAITTGLGLQRPPPPSSRVNPISHSSSPHPPESLLPCGPPAFWWHALLPPPWPGPAPFAAISQLFWEVQAGPHPAAGLGLPLPTATWEPRLPQVWWPRCKCKLLSTDLDRSSQSPTPAIVISSRTVAAISFLLVL